MKDNFKKGIVLIFALLFSALIFAQEDSTDFELAANQLPENDELYEFELIFQYITVSHFSNMTIELLVSNETEEWLAYSESFIISELDESAFFSEGIVSLQPGIGVVGSRYCAVIRLIDSEGLQLIINKNITL